jgi:hypothetical protein
MFKSFVQFAQKAYASLPDYVRNTIAHYLFAVLILTLFCLTDRLTPFLLGPTLLDRKPVFKQCLEYVSVVSVTLIVVISALYILIIFICFCIDHLKPPFDKGFPPRDTNEQKGA